MGNWLKETVDLIRLRAQGKRELSRLPRDELADAINDGWIDRFWKLPSEAWSTAVDQRLESRALNEKADQWAFDIERIHRLGLRRFLEEEERFDADLAAEWDDLSEREERFWDFYDPPEAEVGEPEPVSLTVEEIDELRGELDKIAEELRPQACEGPDEFLSGDFDAAKEAIRRAETLVRVPTADLGGPWESWVAGLPEEARQDGTLACLLWRDMIKLRNRLQEAIQERKTLAGILEDDAQRVLDVRMLDLRSKLRSCEKAYSAYAPFFEQYGRPPLIGLKEETIKPMLPCSPPRNVRKRSEKTEVDPVWKEWFLRVPWEHLSNAYRVRVLFDDLYALHARLAEEVTAVQNGDESARERFEALKPDLIRVDREYHALAEPLFTKYGKPAFLAVRNQERRDEEKAG